MWVNNMKDFYKIYDIVAEVNTPIFIGAGTTLSKKDYYVDEKEKKIYVVNINKLIKRNGKVLTLYEEYVKNIEKTFNEWIENEAKMYLSADIIKNEFTIYTIDIGNADIRGGTKQINPKRKDNKTNNIEKFIKNAYNEVYLPGSSLKGALRTAILSSELLDDKNSITKDNNLKEVDGVIKSFGDRSIRGFGSKNIEKKYFNKLNRSDNYGDATNDLFSYISVSDSDSINLDSLVLCEKIDVDKEGKEHKLNLIRESIKPKTEIRFKINIQSDKNVYSIESILDKIKMYSNYYLQYYNKNFKLPLTNFTGIYLPIGGGVGYISKTITDEAASDGKGAYYISQILGNIFYKHKHYNDYKDLGFAPRLEKSTKYDNQLVPMGLLEIKKVFEPKTNKFILNI